MCGPRAVTGSWVSAHFATGEAPLEAGGKAVLAAECGRIAVRDPTCFSTSPRRSRCLFCDLEEHSRGGALTRPPLGMHRKGRSWRRRVGVEHLDELLPPRAPSTARAPGNTDDAESSHRGVPARAEMLFTTRRPRTGTSTVRPRDSETSGLSVPVAPAVVKKDGSRARSRSRGVRGVPRFAQVFARPRKASRGWCAAPSFVPPRGRCPSGCPKRKPEGRTSPPRAPPLAGP